jgi:tetratricopeptide (TPR) repeat protein
LGVTLYQLNEVERAIGVLQHVVNKNPQNATAWYFLANAELKSRRYARAIEAYRKAIAAAPNLLDAHNNLAWILSVHPEKQLRSGEEALEIAKRLCEATRFQEAKFLDTLAVAYAETGQFETAVEMAKKAIDVAGQSTGNNTAAVAVKPIQDRLKMFENREAYREMEWALP